MGPSANQLGFPLMKQRTPAWLLERSPHHNSYLSVQEGIDCTYGLCSTQAQIQGHVCHSSLGPAWLSIVGSPVLIQGGAASCWGGRWGNLRWPLVPSGFRRKA